MAKYKVSDDFKKALSSRHLWDIISYDTKIITRNRLPRILKHFSDRTPTMLYEKAKHTAHSTLHWNQRKLLIDEIDLLTNYGGHSNQVYFIGSASELHLKFLSELFPNHHFTLWNHKLVGHTLVDDNKQFTIHRRQFTVDDAINTNNVIFIDDYRNPEISKYKQNKDIVGMNKVVLGDMNMKYNLLHHMIDNSVIAMIKFRLPWNDTMVKFYKGDLYYRVWGKLESTECRLLIDLDNTEDVEYDCKLYESQMCYFNQSIKESYYEYEDIYCHCFDCVLEHKILNNYINKTNDMTMKELKDKIDKDLGCALELRDIMINKTI